MTTTFIPCGAKMPIIGLIAGALFGGSTWVATSAYFIGIAAGSGELPLLRKQSADYAAHRATYGLPVIYEEIPKANHFTMMDELASPTGRLTTLVRQLFAQTSDS